MLNMLCLTSLEIMGLSVIVLIVLTFVLLYVFLYKKKAKGVTTINTVVEETGNVSKIEDDSAVKDGLILLSKRTYTVGSGNKVKPATYTIKTEQDEVCIKVNELKQKYKNGATLALVDKDTICSMEQTIQLVK